MNRRDFLNPRQLTSGAGELLGALESLSAPAEEPPSEVALLRASRRAMATAFEIILPFGTPNASAAAAAALDEIDRLEAQLTVYRDSSEVSGLNRMAPYGPVPVEERLFELLSLSAELSSASEGAFDITAGALIKAWGFYRGPRRVPEPAVLQAALERVGMQHVHLDATARTVAFVRPGLELNLGSIGKGYALDRAAETLWNDWKIPAALLHGGHSSVYAIGTEPGDPRGWAVGVAHPWQPESRLALVRLRDRALGTSAATFQHLEYNGRKLGHILDPRTGWPAEGIASATVAAPTAALADGLATAFFIRGVEFARAYCEEHPAIGAILLPDGDAATPVVLGSFPGGVSLFPGMAHGPAGY